MKKAFEKYAKNIKADTERVFIRRVMWSDMEERVRSLFKEIEISPQAKWYGEIRVHGGLLPEAEKININNRLNQLQITCMTKPLGLTSTRECEETLEIAGKLQTTKRIRNITQFETGAVMWFSQSPSGGVTIFMSPCKSDLVSMNEKEIIIGMYKDPSYVSDKIIKNLSSKFFRYASISSAFHNQTLWDYTWRLWLLYLDIRNRKVWKTFLGINFLVIFGGALFTIIGYFLKP